MGAIGMPCEQPVFASDRKRPDIIFNDIVIGGDVPVLDIADKLGPPREGIVRKRSAKAIFSGDFFCGKIAVNLEEPGRRIGGIKRLCASHEL